ncbi:hypothetical protein Tco_0841238 [Tanacetum coccineum]|uniref:Uncharacterized protein n=1 Tax=Tanacetum coccineum TaxID=301880 RepID=A0ABQ5AWV3_9ASTR
MENVNPSSPPKSPNSFLNRKEYEIGDVSEEEIKEEEVVGNEEEIEGVEELGVEYFDKFPTRDELAYQKYLMRGPMPPFFRRCPTIIMKRQLEPRVDPEDLRRISHFMGRIRGMHIFIRNFTYSADFLIVDLRSIIRDSKFTKGVDEVAYQMPHKIEQF